MNAWAMLSGLALGALITNVSWAVLYHQHLQSCGRRDKGAPSFFQHDVRYTGDVDVARMRRDAQQQQAMRRLP